MLGCLDWASAEAEAFAAEEDALLGPPDPEQQAGAAGWWLLRVDPAGRNLSAAGSHPATAA